MVFYFLIISSQDLSWRRCHSLVLYRPLLAPARPRFHLPRLRFQRHFRKLLGNQPRAWRGATMPRPFREILLFQCCFGHSAYDWTRVHHIPKFLTSWQVGGSSKGGSCQRHTSCTSASRLRRRSPTKIFPTYHGGQWFASGCRQSV